MKSSHILLIADGRSPTSLRWIDSLKDQGHRVTLISTYPLVTLPPVDGIFILPVAFSKAGRSPQTKNDQRENRAITWKQTLIQNFRPLMLRIRYLLGPLTLPYYGRKLRKIIADIQPDLVHALRIPFEGMLAVYTPHNLTLLVSIWGNDFTLHAIANKKMTDLTRAVLVRADGLIADTHRDIRLSHQWGFNRDNPTLVVPGGGGIHFDEIEVSKERLPKIFDIDQDSPIIVNPRGIRAYAQTDIFFQAIPLVLKQIPQAKFYCPAMAGNKKAINWVTRLNIENNVVLLPVVSQMELWYLFHQADVTVSLTLHDGTPNTLLEAMACECLPIAGDIEALREWITPGVNGLLVEPTEPTALADAIIASINNPQFRIKAALENQKRIHAKADFIKTNQLTAEFYSRFLDKASN
jgi:glycosyltransferase involved in cell wall biosynthesis